MRCTVALAALLFLSIASCNDPAPVALDAPDQSSSLPALPFSPNASVTTSPACNKSSPSAEYADRPAECVEVSGPGAMTAGSSATFTCRGWGRENAAANDWFEVSTDRPRIWSTTNPNILTVGTSSFYQATVTAVAPGSASVSCRIDGASGSLSVTVTGTRTLVSLFILPDQATLTVGQGRDVGVHYVDNFGQTDQVHYPVDQWISDNTAVATVAPTGEFGGQNAHVTAVGTPGNTQSGVAHIRARVGNITSTPSTITVNPAPVVTSVSVTPTSATIAEYTYVKLTAIAIDQFGRVMTNKTAMWTNDNQNNVTVSIADPMSVNVTGLHWGQANIGVSVDGVQGNTVPITVTTDGQISGFYVSALSPWGDPFTAPGTYYLTPTVTDPNYPPLTYKWEITYSDGRPGVTTAYQAGPYPLSVSSGAYKIYVTVTPKEKYGAGYPTRWIYNVCTGGSGGGGALKAARGGKNTGGTGPTIIQRAVYGCGGTN